MTQTAIANAVSTSTAQAASLGQVVFALLDASGAVVGTPQSVAAAADATVFGPVSFSISVDGTYTVAVQRQDASGALVGAVATSAPFTVVTPVTVTVTIPTSVTATVA